MSKKITDRKKNKNSFRAKRGDGIFYKKAALNLSVEAIIVFVLAFAMLGVGIFVTDQLREIGTAGVETSQDILARIEESPTADKPIVGIKKSGLNLPPKELLQLSLGYYNSGRSTAEDAIVVIDECKSSSTEAVSSYENDGEYPVKVVGLATDVSPSTAIGFELALTNNNLVSGETYICRLKIVNEEDPTIEYETMTFFLNVIS